MADLTDKMRLERCRIIRLLDLQLGSRPGTSEWNDGLNQLERIVERQFAREDDLVLGARCAPNGQGYVRDLYTQVAELRGRVPRLFSEARASNPDMAFMGYLRLSVTLRRWADFLERGI
ncbi:hypothetical protein HC341_04030 [Aquisalimonas sp. 2447]|uniref:hypothetical protein n=1 Tax=Aquisalimonas sp. 2447 TaxID=2740807 RepID=UPI00143262DD|nr:hypothetical protein [Aquisalimonas sp. 2447]QIT54455.1 hypothetical protein HC341_04030 [Aquisalimonas sp. 2447]